MLKNRGAFNHMRKKRYATRKESWFTIDDANYCGRFLVHNTCPTLLPIEFEMSVMSFPVSLVLPLP